MADPNYNIEGLEKSLASANNKKSEYFQLLSTASSEDTLKKVLDYIHEENKAQYGWLSKIFGTEKNASKNITFVILLVIIVLFCCLMGCISEKTPEKNKLILDIIQELIPLFTLGFGYFFGKQ